MKPPVTRSANRELAIQDRRRGGVVNLQGKAFPTYKEKGTSDGFRKSFARSIETELELVRKYGISAQTYEVDGELRVGKSVTQVARETKPALLLWLRLKNTVRRLWNRLWTRSGK